MKSPVRRHTKGKNGMKPSLVGLTAVAACLALTVLAGRSLAQIAAEPAHGATEPAPAPPAATTAGALGGLGGPPVAPGGPPRIPAYPSVRATDPAAVARGRTLFVETFGCASCHAADIRGSDKGNSLLRSIAMMQDANGELIATATRASRTHGGRFNAITESQYADLAQFMKSFTNIGTGPTVPILRPIVFQSGDPAAGAQYFAANCASCHAVTRGQASPAGSLAGIGAGVEPRGIPARDLQQRWLNPRTEKPTTAVVTLADGQRLEGRATRFNEFALNLTLADGSARTIQRDGDNPKIEMTYPLAAHAALLRTITDKQINDVTGYLVTLK
jgi:cytochrome c oxidase cbb3-type subunit 3